MLGWVYETIDALLMQIEGFARPILQRFNFVHVDEAVERWWQDAVEVFVVFYFGDPAPVRVCLIITHPLFNLNVLHQFLLFSEDFLGWNSWQFASCKGFFTSLSVAFVGTVLRGSTPTYIFIQLFGGLFLSFDLAGIYSLLTHQLTLLFCLLQFVSRLTNILRFVMIPQRLVICFDNLGMMATRHVIFVRFLIIFERTNVPVWLHKLILPNDAQIVAPEQRF